MKFDKEMNELFALLDKNENINRILKLKKKITNKELELINNYRSNPNLDNKKKLYENKVINEYLIRENNLNYLIMEINNKFKRSKICQK